MSDSQPYETYSAPPPPQTVQVKLPTAKPVVTYIILGFTIFIFILQNISELMFNGADLPFYAGGKINEFIQAGQAWRFITPVFLHANFLHIGFNMYALYVIGRGMERFFGHGRFTALYFVSGFAGNVASFILSSANSVGASSAIFGIIGAEAVFYFFNRKLFPDVARNAITNIAVLAGINLVIGLSPGIDNWAHIGGLIGGVLFTLLAGPILKIDGLPPFFTLSDQREPRQIWVAALVVLSLFAGAALLTIYLRA